MNKAFKLEYRSNSKQEWHYEECIGSLVKLVDRANKLRSQGFEVRCLNDVGINIV